MSEEQMTEETTTETQGTIAPVETTTIQPIEYNFKVDGVEETDEVKAIYNSISESLKDSGLSADKAQNMVSALFKTLSDMDDNEKRASDVKFEEGKNALIKEWGNNYEHNLDKCNDIILKADNGQRNGDFEMAIRESEINRDPRFVKGLMAIASHFSEDSFVVNNGASINKESINDEIKSLMLDPAYMNEYAPNHKDIVQKVWNLRQKLG